MVFGQILLGRQSMLGFNIVRLKLDTETPKISKIKKNG